ncbi:MAG: glycosyltransferase family 4 protein [Alphaproteobacteria bacterium]|nr:glycosyltransferase family 4 protein [Alphaproteobacteria bacterium]
MASGQADTIKALVLSHDARDLGGVGNFIRILKQRLRPTTTMRRFTNGRRAGESGRPAKLRRMVFDYLRFTLLVLRQRFDIYHFNPEMDLRSFPRESLFMLILILLGKRNFIVFFRGWNWDEFRRINDNPLIRRYAYFVLRRASRVLVLSESFRDALLEQGLADSQLVVMTTMFDGRQVKARDRCESTVNEAPTLLFMARFVEEKGVYQLLEAVSLLKDRFPKLTLVMGGDGPEMAGLKARANALGIEDRVRFPGYVRRQEKARVFDEATIFVFPSYFWEGLPNAVLEAMGAGLPILANPIAGVPEVMSDPENGLFLKDVTAADIAAKLKAMLDDPTYLAETSARNIDKAWSQYESAVVSRRIEDVYRSVMADVGIAIKPVNQAV